MTPAITREQLLRAGAKGGSLILAGGAAMAFLPDAAVAADDPSKQLALLEALAYDFYGKALNTKTVKDKSWSQNWTDALARARENEAEHYMAWAHSPPPPGGYQFSYDASTWKTARGIISFALTLEKQMVASYSAAFPSDGPTPKTVANILPCHVQHAQYFEFIYGKNGKKINPSIVPYFRRAVPYPVFAEQGQRSLNPLDPGFIPRHVHGPGVGTGIGAS
jgi:hypothetical protein